MNEYKITYLCENLRTGEKRKVNISVLATDPIQAIITGRKTSKVLIKPTWVIKNEKIINITLNDS